MATKKPKKELAAVVPVAETTPQTNVDRLLKHLKKDSLAARLVAAHCGADKGAAPTAMKPILSARLKEVRDDFDKT